MSASSIVDWHAHALIKNLPHVNDPLWPRLVYRDDGVELNLGIAPSVLLPRGAFDGEMRLAWMDSQGLHKMVVSPFPSLVADRLETPVAAEIAAITNDGISELVSDSTGRYSGLGTLPFRAGYEEWKDELIRVTDDPHLVGIEVLSSTVIEAAQAGWLRELINMLVDQDAWMFVHPELPFPPHNGMTVGHPLESVGLDVPMDLARAGLALATQGRDEQKVVLTHGGGSLLWLLSGMDDHATNAGLAPEDFPGTLARRRLHVDNLVPRAEHERFINRMLGSHRVVQGSNYPFDNAAEFDIYA